MPKTTTVEELINKLEEQGKGFKYVSGYTKMKEECTFICGNCNKEFSGKPSRVIQQDRFGCKACASKSPKKKGRIIDQELLESRFIKKLTLRYPNGEFEYVAGFKTMENKCLFRCGNCGNNSYVCLPSSIMKPTKQLSCDNCNERNKELTEFGKTNFMKQLDPTYKLLGEYINNKTPITLHHIVCKKEFEYIPNHINMNRFCICPFCNSENTSKNSGYVNRFLRFLEIEYEVEKSFPTLIHERKLKLDFYIPHMGIAIEVDGKHHDRTQDSLLFEVQTDQRDATKNKWCEDNGIKLYRIKHDHDIVRAMIDIFVDDNTEKYTQFNTSAHL